MASLSRGKILPSLVQCLFRATNSSESSWGALKSVSSLKITQKRNHSNSTDKESDKASEKHRDAEKEPLPEWPEGVNPHTGEKGGPKGPEPTRYGDWERKGRVTDF